MQKIVMVYPQQGFSGTYVKHMPLSLLYASSEVVKHGYDVKIVDTRIMTSDWRPVLAREIDADTTCVGISVMSGTPIKHAIRISREIKRIAPHVPVVWGGPHATFYPETILRDEPAVDFVVSGYASRSFLHLCTELDKKGAADFTGVNGLSWRQEGQIRSNPDGQKSFEFIDWRDIPYHLIDDYSPYGQLDQDKRIFSMFSAMGCPYQCTFCSSPAQYAAIDGRKWVPLDHVHIIDHIQHVVEKYGANYIYFIDDDSFPSLKHVEGIIDGIQARGLSVGLGFRGARINEIKKMSDSFLDKLAQCGTDIMHIGAESGSNRILSLMRKNCTVDDIIECNRKLARHPTIIAAYNFIMGLPTETLDDLHQTRDLMLRLVEDNPNCLIFPPNKFRPLPGTELYHVAQSQWGYHMPDTLEAWSNIEVEGDIDSQWYEKGMASFCNLMLVGAYFVDNKIDRVTEGKSALTRFARLVNRFYGPFARLRLRHGWSKILVEYWAYRLLTRFLARQQMRDKPAAP
jgi:radical SAM superfamily enzyme YgiQ (UPF0313 family)